MSGEIDHSKNKKAKSERGKIMFDKINNNAIVMQDCTGEINTFALTKVGMVQLIRHITDLCLPDKSKALIDNQFRKIPKQRGLSITRPTNDFYVSSMLERIETYFYNNFAISKECFELAKSYLKRISLERNASIFPHEVINSWLYGTESIESKIHPTNMVRAYNDGKLKYQFKDRVFYLDGVAFDIKYKKYLKTCVNCGEKYFSQDDIDFVPSRFIGIDGMCRDCALNDNYIECPDCERLFYYNEGVYIDNTDETICEDCFENGNYATCHECGRHINTGNGDYVYSEQQGYYYCNDECAENDGLHWSDYEDDWVEGSEEILDGYHSTCFTKIGLMPANAKQWLGCGIEIEVYGDEPYEHEDFWLNTIKHDFLGDGDYGNIEHDGSVTAEIVMQPMTECAFAKFNYEGMYDALREEGYTGHDNEHCGQHIHYSTGYLGYTDNQIRNSAKKVCAFFEKNWDDLVKISRRKQNQLSWCKKHGFDINQNTDFNNLTTDRYYAVNLLNLFTNKRGTIEIRLPRGTLNAKTTRATVDFFRHIVRNAKNISWKNIDNLKLWFKGIKNKNTIDYIKSRDAFIGEF